MQRSCETPSAENKPGEFGLQDSTIRLFQRSSVSFFCTMYRRQIKFFNHLNNSRKALFAIILLLSYKNEANIAEKKHAFI